MQLIPILLALAFSIVSPPADGVLPAPGVRGELAEVRRVQQHLDGALALLESRDVSALSADQRARRAALVTALTAYRNAGRFPVNRDVPGIRVPVFVDPVTGVHCAVGHLLALTGEEALVARIVARDNLVRVPELRDDVDLRRWLDHHGLTLTEAARIQPTYGPIDDPGPANDLWVPSKSLTVSMIGVSLGAAMFGLTREPQLGFSPASALTLTAGILSVGVGLTGLPAGSRTSGPDAVTAGMAIVTGTGAILAARRLARPNTWSPEEAAGRASRAAFTPILPSRERGAGLMVRIRF